MSLQDPLIDLLPTSGNYVSTKDLCRNGERVLLAPVFFCIAEQMRLNLPEILQGGAWPEKMAQRQRPPSRGKTAAADGAGLKASVLELALIQIAVMLDTRDAQALHA